jgi:hypothetical protein
MARNVAYFEVSDTRARSRTRPVVRDMQFADGTRGYGRVGARADRSNHRLQRNGL